MVLDFVGGPYWGKHMSCLAQDGRLVLLGLVSVHAILDMLMFLLM